MSVDLEKIYLVDVDPELVNEWQVAFADIDIVEPVSSDYFEVPADCLVSPANSFGFMDGGLDAVISYELGDAIQVKVQSEIVTRYHGELPVGCAVIVETDNKVWPYLISAPTMRIPEDVSQSVNAYLAFRAILLEIAKFNQQNPKTKIKSLLCPGLATGIGNMSAKRCATQMKEAYVQCALNAKIPSVQEIRSIQSKMQLGE